MKTNIQIKQLIHRDKPQLFLQFDYDAGLIRNLKNIANASWSQTHKSWYIPDNTNLLNKLKSELEPLGIRLQLPQGISDKGRIKQPYNEES